MSKALVTLMVGETYTDFWTRFARPTWEPYAERHGYEIVALNQVLDESERARGRAFNWQKLLILEHPDVRDFERVVWLDSDVLINFHAAPCIASNCPRDKVGALSYRDTLFRDPEGWEHVMRRLGDETPIAERYAKAGLPADVDDYTCAGVLVYAPERHAEHLRHVYDAYEQNEFSAKEELPLSYHLYKNDLAAPIDPRFHRLWLYELARHYTFLMEPAAKVDPLIAGFAVNAAWTNSWFMHFTADLLGGFNVRQHAALVVRHLQGLDAARALRDASDRGALV